MQDANMEVEAGSSSGHSQTVNGKKRKREVEEVPEQTIPDADVNKNEATIRFVVRDLHKLSEAQSSPPCYVHSSPTWRIVVMPRISTTSPQRQTLGFIFQCSGDVGSTLRSCFASAELRLISQLEGVQTIVKRVRGAFSCNRFHGFADFLPWTDVLDPAKGYIKDDTIILEVHMVADIPDSKKPNIYMELRYPGATTHLSSLLHTLYFINQFRKIVYQIPAQSNDGRKSTALALQPLFYKLQIMDKSLDEQTKTLIERLGLNTTTDYFKRHGVHEFVRTLLDNLERNMKGTSVEGMVSKLFEGKMVSYIKCKNVDCSSTQVVTFYDIQLDVTGKKNLSESFSDYMKAKVLDGDNKYDAGEHGLQDAEKYVRFISLPPVLLIHMVRSQYDPSIDGSLQNNERFEFQNKLNLSPFLQTPEGTPAEYTLHTMLFRSCDNRSDDNCSDNNRSDDNRSDDNRSDDNRSDANRKDDNGSDANRSDANRNDANRNDANLHYAALINAKSYRNLYDKFYDDAGSRSFVHNYGGRVGEINSSPRKPMCVPNAYMMVYIRDSELDNILREVTEDDIPDELVKRLGERTRLMEREAHRTTVEVLLEESFHGHQGSGLFDPDKVSYRPFRVDKSTTLQGLMDLFARTFKCPVEQLRLWPLGLRWNRTLRPSQIDVAADLRKSLLDVSKGQDPWKVFLEGVPHDAGLSALPPYETDSHVLLFYRMYDPVERRIHYCGHQCVHVTSTFQDLIPMLNERAGFPADTELLLFEEIKPDLVRSIRNLCKPMESVLEDFMDGNIIVFQKKPVENQGRLNAEEAEFPTCQEYFRDLYYRMEVTLCDKMNPDDPGVTVELSMMRNYSHLAAAAARRIHTDPDRLRFFTTSKDNPGNAGSAVESNFKGRLKDLFIFPNPNGLKKIYYQQLTMPVFELESKGKTKY